MTGYPFSSGGVVNDSLVDGMVEEKSSGGGVGINGDSYGRGMIKRAEKGEAVGVEDGEEQGDYTVAAIGGGEELGVVAGFGVGLVVPLVAVVVDGVGDGFCHRMVHNQMTVHQRVAAVNALEGVACIGCFGKNLSGP